MKNLRFDICADDYGLNPKVNEAIVDLIRVGQVQHVSILIEKVNSEDLDKLKIYSSQILLGLHLDIFSGGIFSTLVEIILFPDRISLKIKRQIHLFEKLLGHFPHFVDGHMHCHIYPIIGDQLLSILSKMTLKSDFYFRKKEQLGILPIFQNNHRCLGDVDRQKRIRFRHYQKWS